MRIANVRMVQAARSGVDLDAFNVGVYHYREPPDGLR